MANVEKLRQRKNRLGAPPSADEASNNIYAPEVAPAVNAMDVEEKLRLVSSAAMAPTRESVVVPTSPARDEIPPPAPPTQPASKGERLIDGRSLRRTGRTIPFATRVSEAFHQRLRIVAERDQLLIVEVLERALEAYESERGKNR